MSSDGVGKGLFVLDSRCGHTARKSVKDQGMRAADIDLYFRP